MEPVADSSVGVEFLSVPIMPVPRLKLGLTLNIRLKTHSVPMFRPTVLSHQLLNCLTVELGVLISSAAYSKPKTNLDAPYSGALPAA